LNGNSNIINGVKRQRNIKVGKTPATQNLVFEQYAVKIGNSTLFLYDKILIYHDCDFKKMRIQKLLNRDKLDH
jgi:hypothetical protein